MRRSAPPPGSFGTSSDSCQCDNRKGCQCPADHSKPKQLIFVLLMFFVCFRCPLWVTHDSHITECRRMSPLMTFNHRIHLLKNNRYPHCIGKQQNHRCYHPCKEPSFCTPIRLVYNCRCEKLFEFAPGFVFLLLLHMLFLAFVLMRHHLKCTFWRYPYFNIWPIFKISCSASSPHRSYL